MVGVELLPFICHESSMPMPLSLSFVVVNGITIVGNISVNAGVGNSGDCCCCGCCEIGVSLARRKVSSGTRLPMSMYVKIPRSLSWLGRAESTTCGIASA